MQGMSWGENFIFFCMYLSIAHISSLEQYIPPPLICNACCVINQVSIYLAFIDPFVVCLFLC